MPLTDELDDLAVEDLTEDLAIEEAEDFITEDATTEEIDEAFLEEALLVGVPDGTEHSFTPPDTRAPKVASEHTKLPDISLK